MDNKSFYLIQFHKITDRSGHLVALEENRNLPFDVKRIFYIYGVSGNIVRGNHANRFSRIVFIAVKGKCKISVKDGNSKQEFILSRPEVGLFTDRMTWKELSDFSPDCVLLALSDAYYDKQEYITDYEEFKRLKREKN